MMRLEAALLLVSVSGAFVGCQKQNEFVPPPPPQVTVSNPQTEVVTTYLESTGTTEAIASVEVRARVSGFLEKVLFEDGDGVDKDEVLCVIDPREYKAAVRQAEASLAQAKAALDLQEATRKRMEEAVKTNAVSVLDVIEAQAKEREAAATVEARDAELVRAKLNLSYTEIRAPMAGRVGRCLVDPGNLVGQGDNTLLTTIVQYDPIYANFDISERDLLEMIEMHDEAKDAKEHLERIRKIPVELGVANTNDYPHRGNLFYVDQGVDSATGTLLVQGIFPNPMPPKILPGFFVRVRIPQGSPQEKFVLTERALGSDQGGKYVLVVDDQNVVQHRRVVVGETLGGGRVVIESGVGAEDSVIVNGLLKARPGAKVAPQRVEAEASTTAAAGG